ncbi:MAG: hypothetical protein K6G88_10800 [Lachnospiraceae bacterium]|nr:hypothetical protein [Lachnospiraceae bacterium]
MKNNYIETSDFRIAACNCCTALLRDKVDTSGQNEILILEIFKSKHNLEQSLPEIKALIKSIYFENLSNDKYGINKLKD